MVGQVTVESSMVHRVQTGVFIVLSEHVQPLSLLHVAGSFMLPTLFDCKVVKVLSVIIVWFPVPVRALCFVKPWCCKAVKGVTP